MSITSKIIRSEFKKAEEAYEFCWDVLITMKTRNMGKGSAVRLMAFQDKLATAIFELQRVRDMIILEEKAYVKNKSRYQFEWFKNKLQTLSKYKKAIDRMVNIAKDLGDAFAHFFYQFEHDLLNEHLSHEVVINHTSGLGELGELAFVKNIKHLNKEFPIYHGITNILRYGDFSFVDLRTLKISRIGELKTKQVDEKKLNGMLYIIDREKVNQKEAKQRLMEERPKDRRERQILGISKFLSIEDKDPKIDGTIVNESYAIKIGELIDECPINGQLSKQLSPGLAFLCFRFKKASLFHKLLNREIDEVERELEKMFTTIVTKLVKSEEKRNSLIIGQLLHVDKKFDPCIPGTIPLFWTNMENKALKKIYFKDSHLISLFNPVHLILDVEKMGFQVDSKYSHPPVRTPDKLFAVVQRFDLFIGYIIRHLMTEEFVLDFIREIQKSPYWGTNAKISMKPQQKIFL
ncbi:hypothetical protein CPT03_07080 [Pedobacter ginsengisoli]|uniref:Uncharacterized protein n=1 Tax=Pedobacter ginsengisoli TaxID=363852 RepID=A0A2D1U3U4_9SPHI|nr:hypothetical protein [Pedobacter ginsengisoli]ATP56248.1 hypothetical protein CPT03_07080 [Pedobacter ginsengisoli]